MADNEANKKTLVDEFCKITSAREEQGTIFLEASGWNLDIAVASFYEDYEENVESFDQPQQVAPSTAPSIPPAPYRPSSSGPRIATIASLSNNDEEEEGGQAFYAGGSERSGQQILGPPDKKNYPAIVEEMFKAAKSHGAEVVDPSSRPARRPPANFDGQGHTLGSGNDDSTAVPSASASATSSPPHVHYHLKLWQNGFSIDDGPLRDYNDPTNEEFLNSIRRGEIPRELIRIANGGEVHIDMNDRRHEAFIAPKVVNRPFAGTGHRLGSPMPALTSEKTASKEDAKSQEEEAKRNLNVNPELPTTNIQIRLSDGSRLVIRCNHHHTLADIKQYVIRAHPEYASSLFELMTTYPIKELTEDSETVKDLNLLNAGLILKLK